MNPPKNVTKTSFITIILILFLSIAFTLASDENHSTYEEEPHSEKYDDSILYETSSKEDVKFVTNSLQLDTTIAPEVSLSEDISNESSLPSSSKKSSEKSSEASNEENSRLTFGREGVQVSKNRSSDVNSKESEDQFSPLVSVPFPSGPESYETPVELESEALTSEETFSASSHEFTSDLDDTSMFSTSSVFSRLPPSGEVTKTKPEEVEENPRLHSHETYRPRGKYNSEHYKQNEDNFRQRILQPTTDSQSAFMSRSDIIDDSHTENEATQKTTMPKQKTGKTIKTYKSSADQVLRQFVENGYLRHPLACIVDTTDINLRKAQILWNATLRSNAPLDMVLSGYNSTGEETLRILIKVVIYLKLSFIGVAAIYSFKNSRTLLTGLHSLRESGRSDESGQAYTAILKTSVLIPYDSAIFLSTDDDPSDVKYFDQCATVLIKKRIRVRQLFKQLKQQSSVRKLFALRCLLEVSLSLPLSLSLSLDGHVYSLKRLVHMLLILRLNYFLHNQLTLLSFLFYINQNLNV